ncbi:MAG: DNA polymerase III subunit delta [Desulfurivibrio sp.]|nr:DNA polymerase III subunit delta [Desulfurivibrio sp.]
MSTLQRKDLADLCQQIAAGRTAPVYLLVGERYLCREAADQLSAALLPEPQQRANQLTVIDGEREEPPRTMAALKTYSLFGGRQVIQVVDSRIFLSKTVAKTLWQQATQARESGDHGDADATRLLLAMLQLAGLSLAEWQQQQAAGLSAADWQHLFGFAKPDDSQWAETLLAALEPATAPAPPAGGGDGAETYLTALESGLPPHNHLILLAATADRRKKLYKYLEQHGVVVDLSVAAGSSTPARKEQKNVLGELARRTLAEFDKKLAADALDPLLERIGFQPVAVVMECEKLALYIGERPRVERRDVDAMVGRTREEAIYELSEAYSAGELERGLILLKRLRGGGMHPLAMVAGLRNHIRKLLLAQAVLGGADGDFQPEMPFPVFQKNFLPRLKEQRQAAGGRGWPTTFPNHPYALYQLFRQAAGHHPADLRARLADLLQAEYRLKGSGLPEQAILGALFFTAATPTNFKEYNARVI